MSEPVVPNPLDAPDPWDEPTTQPSDAATPSDTAASEPAAADLAPTESTDSGRDPVSDAASAPDPWDEPATPAATTTEADPWDEPVTPVTPATPTTAAEADPWDEPATPATPTTTTTTSAAAADVSDTATSRPAATAPKPLSQPAATKPAATKPAPKSPAHNAKPKAAAATTSDSTKSAVILGRPVRQWAKFGGFGLAAVAGAGILVLAARGLTTLPGVPEFLKHYPGAYESPVEITPGFPLWARWTHYLNFFFLVLIVRSGLLVRLQQRPPAYYTPRRGGKKISINLWLHTSLDLLWLINGLIFVVLLFATGHWARIVPTSWEVFPNAASAALQYLTLEWPTEDGWVNYNSLQQLAYFVIVFIAAPLAIISGVRMSEWWPKEATKLNQFYPAPVARAIHFPTMLFFVLFAIGHVTMVFATGALKNLNHMYAGRTEVSWVGFGFFALGLAVVAAAVFAARPAVISPIANLVGRVSSR